MQVQMKTRRNGGGKKKDEGGLTEYEKCRQQRMKQNLEKIQKLGILDLSRKLKLPSKPKTTTIRPLKPSPSSLRRSLRLLRLSPTKYAFKDEVYSEDDVKMLGDHKETWKLEEEDVETYYTSEGTPCHQCRRKVAGIHSICCKCKTAKSLFCGNCLFKRYGENVIEARANPDWVCPLCRDICNCSHCRRAKGWEPIGNFYLKALHLGFKSVAHYLIHTHGPHRKQDDTDDCDQVKEFVQRLEI